MSVSAAGLLRLRRTALSRATRAVPSHPVRFPTHHARFSTRGGDANNPLPAGSAEAEAFEATSHLDLDLTLSESGLTRKQFASIEDSFRRRRGKGETGIHILDNDPAEPGPRPRTLPKLTTRKLSPAQRAAAAASAAAHAVDADPGLAAAEADAAFEDGDEVEEWDDADGDAVGPSEMRIIRDSVDTVFDAAMSDTLTPEEEAYFYGNDGEIDPETGLRVFDRETNSARRRRMRPPQLPDDPTTARAITSFARTVPGDAPLPRDLQLRVNQILHDARYKKGRDDVFYEKDLEVWYIANRLPAVFSVLRRIMSEISARVPGYRPQNILEFAAGASAGLWAAREVFYQDFAKYTCIERDGRLALMGQQLTSDLGVHIVYRPRLPTAESAAAEEKAFKEAQKRRRRRGAPRVERTSLPASIEPGTQDMVVSAYALSKQPNAEYRRQLLEALWEHVSPHGGLLVLVESAEDSAHGFNVIRESRDYLLQRFPTSASSTAAGGLGRFHADDPAAAAALAAATNGGRGSGVFSAPAEPAATAVLPCAHDKPCPMGAMQALKSEFYRLRAQTRITKEPIALPRVPVTVCKFGERMLRKPLPSQSPMQDLKIPSHLGDAVLENFSYVVLQRGRPRVLPSDAFDPPAPRVAPPRLHAEPDRSAAEAEEALARAAVGYEAIVAARAAAEAALGLPQTQMTSLAELGVGKDTLERGHDAVAAGTYTAPGVQLASGAHTGVGAGLAGRSKGKGFVVSPIFAGRGDLPLQGAMGPAGAEADAAARAAKAAKEEQEARLGSVTSESIAAKAAASAAASVGGGAGTRHIVSLAADAAAEALAATEQQAAVLEGPVAPPSPATRAVVPSSSSSSPALGSTLPFDPTSILAADAVSAPESLFPPTTASTPTTAAAAARAAAAAGAGSGPVPIGGGGLALHGLRPDDYALPATTPGANGVAMPPALSDEQAYLAHNGDASSAPLARNLLQAPPRVALAALNALATIDAPMARLLASAAFGADRVELIGRGLAVTRGGNIVGKSKTNRKDKLAARALRDLLRSEAAAASGFIDADDALDNDDDEGEEIDPSDLIGFHSHGDPSAPSEPAVNPKELHHRRRWARIVSPGLKRGGHVVLDLCTPTGTIERRVIGRGKVGSAGYKHARRSRWGDLWPYEHVQSKNELKRAERLAEVQTALEAADSTEALAKLQEMRSLFSTLAAADAEAAAPLKDELIEGMKAVDLAILKDIEARERRARHSAPAGDHIPQEGETDVAAQQLEALARARAALGLTSAASEADIEDLVVPGARSQRTRLDFHSGSAEAPDVGLDLVGPRPSMGAAESAGARAVATAEYENDLLLTDAEGEEGMLAEIEEQLAMLPPERRNDPAVRRALEDFQMQQREERYKAHDRLTAALKFLEDAAEAAKPAPSLAEAAAAAVAAANAGKVTVGTLSDPTVRVAASLLTAEAEADEWEVTPGGGLKRVRADRKRIGAEAKRMASEINDPFAPSAITDARHAYRMAVAEESAAALPPMPAPAPKKAAKTAAKASPAAAAAAAASTTTAEAAPASPAEAAALAAAMLARQAASSSFAPGAGVARAMATEQEDVSAIRRARAGPGSAAGAGMETGLYEGDDASGLSGTGGLSRAAASASRSSFAGFDEADADDAEGGFSDREADLDDIDALFETFAQAGIKGKPRNPAFAPPPAPDAGYHPSPGQPTAEARLATASTVSEWADVGALDSAGAPLHERQRARRHARFGAVDGVDAAAGEDGETVITLRGKAAGAAAVRTPTRADIAAGIAGQGEYQGPPLPSSSPAASAAASSSSHAVASRNSHSYYDEVYGSVYDGNHDDNGDDDFEDISSLTGKGRDLSRSEQKQAARAAGAARRSTAGNGRGMAGNGCGGNRRGFSTLVAAAMPFRSFSSFATNAASPGTGSGAGAGAGVGGSDTVDDMVLSLIFDPLPAYKGPHMKPAVLSDAETTAAPARTLPPAASLFDAEALTDAAVRLRAADGVSASVRFPAPSSATAAAGSGTTSAAAGRGPGRGRALTPAELQAVISASSRAAAKARAQLDSPSAAAAAAAVTAAGGRVEKEKGGFTFIPVGSATTHAAALAAAASEIQGGVKGPSNSRFADAQSPLRREGPSSESIAQARRILAATARATPLPADVSAHMGPSDAVGPVSVDSSGRRTYKDKHGNTLSDDELDEGESRRVVHPDGTIEYVPHNRRSRGPNLSPGVAAALTGRAMDSAERDEMLSYLSLTRRIEADPEHTLAGIGSGAGGAAMGRAGPVAPTGSLRGINKEEKLAQRDERVRRAKAEFRFRVERGRKALIEQQGGKYRPNPGIYAVSKAEAALVFANAGEDLINMEAAPGDVSLKARLRAAAEQADEEEAYGSDSSDLEINLDLVPLKSDGTRADLDAEDEWRDPRALSKLQQRRAGATLENHDAQTERLNIVRDGVVGPGDDLWRVHQAAERVKEGMSEEAKRMLEAVEAKARGEELRDTGKTPTFTPTSFATATPIDGPPSSSHGAGGSSNSTGAGSGSDADSSSFSFGVVPHDDAAPTFNAAARAARAAKKTLRGAARAAAAADAVRTPGERVSEQLITPRPSPDAAAAVAAANQAAHAAAAAAGGGRLGALKADADAVSAAVDAGIARKKTMEDFARERVLFPGRVRSAAEITAALDAFGDAHFLPENNRRAAIDGEEGEPVTEVVSSSSAPAVTADTDLSTLAPAERRALADRAKRAAAAESAAVPAALRRMSLTDTLARVGSGQGAGVSPRLAALAQRFEALKAREQAQVQRARETFQPIVVPGLGDVWTGKNKVETAFNRTAAEVGGMMYQARAHRSVTADLEEEDMLRRLGDKDLSSLASLLPPPAAVSDPALAAAGGAESDAVLRDAIEFERRMAEAEDALKDMMSTSKKLVDKKIASKQAKAAAAADAIPVAQPTGGRSRNGYSNNNRRGAQRGNDVFDMPMAEIIRPQPVVPLGRKRGRK